MRLILRHRLFQKLLFQNRLLQNQLLLKLLLQNLLRAAVINNSVNCWELKKSIGLKVLNGKIILAVLTLMSFNTIASHAQTTTNKDLGHTQVYKSIGEFGEVKYSQFEPINGNQAEIIQMRRDGRQSQPGRFAADPVNLAFNTKTSSYQNNNSQNNSYRNKRKLTTSNRQQTSAQAQCQKLHSNLASLQGGGDVYESQSNGERRYLDVIEVALKLEDTQKLVTQYCKDS